MADTLDNLSINTLAGPLIDRLLTDAAQLRLGISRLDNGTTIIDGGINSRGGLEAGVAITELCLAGLGRVRISQDGPLDGWRNQIEVATSQPVLACLGCQYAGWSLSHKDPKFYALGSGPGRVLAGKEELIKELGLTDRSDRTALVVETDKVPPAALADRVAESCGIAADALTLVLTPTGSLAGLVQVVGRVVEVALHKAHALHFPLDRIVDALGSAPLPPPTRDGLAAMGRTNDAILFGGRVQLIVDADETEAEQLARQLPSSASNDYGKPFAKVFKDYNYDFFQVDPMLFSPAEVSVTVLGSGRTFRAGRLDPALIDQSFND